MELKTPIRIYWDLPVASNAPKTALEICDQVLSLRVLALDLHAMGDTLPAELFEVVQKAKGSGVAVTVRAAAGALPPEVQQSLAELAVRGFLLDVTSLGELQALPAGYCKAGTGVSYPVTEESLSELPQVVQWCVAQGIKRLVFPIQRAHHCEAPFHLGAARGRELARELAGLELPPALQLTIHDPLLWKAFYPERPFPEGGCQAANSMLFIAPDTTVYPCPVMPYRLGSLAEETLAQIVASQRKRQLRQRLQAPPAECLPCPEVKECLGGCRGKGYLLQQSWDTADPSCR